jgi:hypothetical protein
VRLQDVRPVIVAAAVDVDGAETASSTRGASRSTAPDLDHSWDLEARSRAQVFGRRPEPGDRLVGHRDDPLGESSPGPAVRLRHRGDGLDVHACQVHRRRAGDIRIIGCRPFTCDPGTPARVVYSAGSRAGQEASADGMCIMTETIRRHLPLPNEHLSVVWQQNGPKTARPARILAAT